MKKCQFAISWARSCQYQCLCHSLSKYSTQFKRQGHFHFFRIWRSAKLRPMINIILQFLEIDLVNFNVSAKFYQHIPNSLRVKFHCFQNLNLGKTSTNPFDFWHVTYLYIKCFNQDQKVKTAVYHENLENNSWKLQNLQDWWWWWRQKSRFL